MKVDHMFRCDQTVNWVGQTDKLGCVAAVLAMILGRTYEEMKTEFVGERDFVERGINYQDIDDYLACRGISTARKWNYRLTKEREACKEWPPAPFAELHLCVVVVSPQSPMSHFVLMRGDGSVLDPLTPDPKRLTDYHRIHNVAAIVSEKREIK